MPFPAKTDRARVLAAAMGQLEKDGMEKLSLRSLAASLEVAPTALYRYFPSRAFLQAAIVAEVTGQVHAGLRKAAGRKSPEPAIRALAQAYRVFAREQTHFYQAFLTCTLSTPDGEAAHTALWEFVLSRVARVSGEQQAPQAAVALWSLLHGFVDLEGAGAFTRHKPASGFAWGLDAWFKAARVEQSPAED